MTDSLGTYLHDHLAGATYAIELVEFMRDQHHDDDLGRFAAEIAAEIKQDRATLQRIAERVGSGGATLKDAASWVGEKVSRFKLGHDAGSGLATFEALEFLAIGILGKRALWRTLAAIAPSDPRLSGVDFESLAVSAQKQHDKVDRRRLQVARTALRSNSGSAGTATADQHSGSRTMGGLTMRKSTVAGSVAIAAGVLLTVFLLPDIIRYTKLRSM